MISPWALVFANPLRPVLSLLPSFILQTPLYNTLKLSWPIFIAFVSFWKGTLLHFFCTRYDFMISLLFNAVSTLILCKHTCNQTHVLHLTWSYCTNMNHTQLPLRQPLSGIWPTMVDFAEGTPVKPAHANPEYIKYKSAMIICSDHNMQACQKYLATKISTPSSLHTFGLVGFRMVVLGWWICPSRKPTSPDCKLEGNS